MYANTTAPATSTSIMNQPATLSKADALHIEARKLIAWAAQEWAAHPLSPAEFRQQLLAELQAVIGHDLQKNLRHNPYKSISHWFGDIAEMLAHTADDGDGDGDAVHTPCVSSERVAPPDWFLPAIPYTGQQRSLRQTGYRGLAPLTTITMAKVLKRAMWSRRK